jgi:hypothetical protein
VEMAIWPEIETELTVPVSQLDSHETPKENVCHSRMM